MNTEKRVVRARALVSEGIPARAWMSWNSRQATSRHQHPASGMSQAAVWTTATKGKQEKKTGNLATAGMPATGQRWASTLANRSTARHRSNIRAPPTPPPRCMYPKCENLCGQRGRKRFIASWDLRMSHICTCTPCPSSPGYRSKVESRHFAHLCNRTPSTSRYQ